MTRIRFNTRPLLNTAAELLTFGVMAGMTLVAMATAASGPAHAEPAAVVHRLPTVVVTGKIHQLPTVVVTAKRAAPAA
jgi:hypothetical protein